jgi:hypothetical protein
MANQVYANMMEVSCKAAEGKSVCAFPDVCFTPPQTPATPPGVPIPYPNTGLASDCVDGSTTVQISGQEVMLKNKSYFKKSSGDEAGNAPKKGVITSQITGKVYFTMWSMDVKIEGENVDRHLDLMTHNHASEPGNTPPWAYLDALAPGASADCKASSEKTSKCMEKHVKNNTHQGKRKAFKAEGATAAEALSDSSKVDWDKLLADDGGAGKFYNKSGALSQMCDDDDCKDQLDCNLVPFDFGCCDNKTPHHIVPAHCFMPSGERKAGSGARYSGTESYDDTKAPCICLDGATKSSLDAGGNLMDHGLVHNIVDPLEDKNMSVQTLTGPRGGVKVKKTAGSWSFAAANDAGAKGVTEVTGCDKECLMAQSEAAHKHLGLDVGEGKSDKLMLRADSSGKRAPPGFVPADPIAAPFAD